MRMVDELERTEAWIQEIRATPEPAPELFALRTTEIVAETERIKKAFVRHAFEMSKEKRIERFIQYHQSTLVYLIDCVVGLLPDGEIEYINVISQECSQVNMLKISYANLEQLLAYIEKHFTKYFSLSAKTPESYRFMVHREIRSRLPEVRYALEKKGINKRLLAIVLFPLDTFVECITAEEVSYRRIIYLRQLLNELGDLRDSRLTETRFDVRVCLTLCYLNYNAPSFVKFCTNEITRRVQEQTTLSDQIERLSLMLKIANQLQPKPSFIYDESMASVRDQLSAWIGEEILFFEKRQRLASVGPNPEDPVQKEFKLRLNLSVAQIGCLIRALKELGVIRNNNMLEVIRFFAAMLQTKNTDQVSWESLRAKYYQVETSARETIREFSVQLNRTLDKF